ncbi:MAG TPA: heat-shock protein Hsp20 [Clostridiales bacterium]|nr:heat-shock protein Hsp20 [Clostridiales bacterium]
MRDMIERFDDWDLGELFNGLFEPVRFDKQMRATQMKTDIKEDENGYELDIDLPGFEKNEIDVSLKNGYLNVSAKKAEKFESSKENLEHKEHEKEEKGCGCEHENCNCKEHKKPYIRRERSYFASRSFYVGDKIKEEDIKAKYNNGVLSLFVPKENPKQLESRKISIE